LFDIQIIPAGRLSQQQTQGRGHLAFLVTHRQT